MDAVVCEPSSATGGPGPGDTGPDRAPLPEPLQRFVRDCVGSLWTVEALLLMHRAPARTWRAAELVRELRASPGVVSAVVGDLGRHGLIVREEDGGLRYGAANADLDALAGQLAQTFAERPQSIIEIVADPHRALHSLAAALVSRSPGELD